MGYTVNVDSYREVEWNKDQTRIIKKRTLKRGDPVTPHEDRVENLLAQGAIVEDADYDENVRRPEVEETPGAGSTPPAPADLLGTPPDAGAGDADDEYSDMTVADLQEEAESRDLPKSGNKAELQARLREDDANSE